MPETRALSISERELVRADHALDWPFTVDKGKLACMIFGDQKIVLFSEPDPNPKWPGYGPGYVPARTLIVSTNPFNYLVNIEDRSLLAPFDNDLAVLIRRMAPLEAMGRELCDKPQSRQD